jgi:TolB-like protein
MTKHSINGLVRFWQELKRRKVLHVVVVYATAAFIIIELVNNVYEPLNLPDWTPSLFIIILAVGFPFAIVISWIFDISFKGIEKTPSMEVSEGTRAPSGDSSRAEVPDHSIIVLPFENISPDPDQEYFSDGLTEEIITDLSHIDGLLVISRSSAMTFKGSRKTIPEIAQSARVRYALEGSVRKTGNNLRITAQLIDATNDAHLWADKYEGTLDDIFQIQENVSKKIVEALKGKLTARDKRMLVADQYDQNAGIYDAYSRAHYFFWKYEPGCQERALKLMEDAMAAFGEHPILISGIGAIHWQFYHLLGDINEMHLKKIEECAKKLFAMDPESAEGHRLISYVDLHNGRITDAIRHLARSMEVAPGDTETLLWLSYLLTFHAGRPELARPVAERWRAIDPLSPISIMSEHLIQWMTGDLDNAAKGFKEWHLQEPDNPIPSFYLGHLLAWKGRHNEAWILAEEMHRQDPDEGMGQALRFLICALRGDQEKARNAVTGKTREWIWNDFHLPWLMAEGHSLMGENDASIMWLDRAVKKGFFNYPLFKEADPLLAEIRKDPRFEKIIEGIKSRWENFDV